MKTLRDTIIEKYSKEFLTEDGKDRLCTTLTIPFEQSFLNLELTDADSIWNVLYEDISIKLSVSTEKLQSITITNIPKFIASALFLAYQSGTESAILLLQKSKYEDNCHKYNIPIGYDNTIG